MARWSASSRPWVSNPSTVKTPILTSASTFAPVSPRLLQCGAEHRFGHQVKPGVPLVHGRRLCGAGVDGGDQAPHLLQSADNPQQLFLERLRGHLLIIGQRVA